METFSALLAFCVRNSPVTGEYPSQRPVTRSFDVFCDLRLNNRCVNNRDAGELRRHRVHYDVIVMIQEVQVTTGTKSFSDIVLATSLVVSFTQLFKNYNES